MSRWFIIPDRFDRTIHDQNALDWLAHFDAQLVAIADRHTKRTADAEAKERLGSEFSDVLSAGRVRP